MGRKSEDQYKYEEDLLRLREPSPTRSTHSSITISSSSEAPKKSRLRRGLSKILPGQKKSSTQPPPSLPPPSPTFAPSSSVAPKVDLPPPPSSIHSSERVEVKPSPPTPPTTLHDNAEAERPSPPLLPAPTLASARMSSPVPATATAPGRYDESQAQGNRRLAPATSGPNSVLRKEPGTLLKGATDENGELKAAALMLGIKLDLEAEIHLTARVRGDITVGLY